MSQYHPVHRAVMDSAISRTITEDEYGEAIRMAEELGFERLLVQHMDFKLHNLPDFRNRHDPFPMKKAFNQDF